MKMVKLFTAACTLAFLALSGGANAATLGVDQCQISVPSKGNGKDKTLTFTLEGATEATCVENANDANTIGLTDVYFGMSGWSLTSKYNANGSGSDFNFGDGTAASGNDITGGKIFADLTGFGSAFIVLKAGNHFGAFLTSTADSVWDWSTTQGISHVSLWTKGVADPGPDPAPKVTPLPAGGVLLLSALGLAFVRRQKR